MNSQLVNQRRAIALQSIEGSLRRLAEVAKVKIEPFITARAIDVAHSMMFREEYVAKQLQTIAGAPTELEQRHDAVRTPEIDDEVIIVGQPMKFWRAMTRQQLEEYKGPGMNRGTRRIIMNKLGMD